MTLHHRTTDPIQRAVHIADRAQREHEHALAIRGDEPYRDWPSYWRAVFWMVLRELTGVES